MAKKEPTYLSRFIVCSTCGTVRAEFTLLDRMGEPVAYLCTECAKKEEQKGSERLF